MAKKFYSTKEGMLNSDKSAPANMPQKSFIKIYPESPGYLPENLNDGMSGIDSQMGLDNTKKKSSLKPKKV